VLESGSKASVVRLRPVDARANAGWRGERPPLYLVATLLLVAALVVPLHLGLQDVVDINESQRLLPPIEMAQRHDWVLPTIDGELYLTKPPLTYWIIGGAYALLGSVAPLAGRAPVALVSLLTAAGVLAIGWRHANPHVGVWSALVLLSAFFFRVSAHEAEIDPFLAGAVLGMVYAQWRAATDARWLRAALVCGVAFGCGLLLKGPVVLPFLAAATVAIALAARPNPRRLIAATAVATAVGFTIALPWVVLVARRVSFHVVSATLEAESVQRIYAASRINSGPVYFYAAALAAGFLPWTWMLALYAGRGPRAHARALSTSWFGVAGLFCLGSFVPFSLFAGKEVKYLLPLFPFMAILAGHALDWLLRADDVTARRGARVAISCWAVAGIGALVAFLTPLGPWLRASPACSGLVIAGSAVCALAFASTARHGRQISAALLVTGLTLAIVGVQDALKVRRNATKSPRMLIGELTRVGRTGVPCYRFRVGRVGAYHLRELTRKLPDDTPPHRIPALLPRPSAIVTRTSEAASVQAGAAAAEATVAAVSGPYVLMVFLGPSLDGTGGAR